MYQSFMQAFISNSPALLAQGQTVDALAIGQIGILDAKTYKAVTAPTYATSKALSLVWGTPNIDLGLLGGVPNENEYSKLIKGKLIKNFRAKKASRPQNQKITIGWSGDVADTNTLYADEGEVKRLYLKLTGSAIDKLYSKQGYIRMYSVDTSCWSKSNDCDVTCDPVDCTRLANEFVKMINGDKTINRLIKAKAITQCTPAVVPVTTNCYVFEVDMCDDGTGSALGIVQAQYPGLIVSRVGRVGSVSTYSVTLDVNVAPAAVSNAGMLIIPDCPTCPAGYTLVANGSAYSVSINDTGDGAALTAATAAYGVVAPETIVRLSYEFGTSTYLITSATALTAVGTDVVTLVGDVRDACVLTTPATFPWNLAKTLVKFEKDFTITLADTICGTNRLADLQAAYPSLVISVVDAAGSCVHSYKATIKSNCVETGCSIEDVHYVKPVNFEGATWEEVVVANAPGTTCLCGIEIETAFVNRLTNECTFDYFPAYDYDTVFVQASNFEPDWNGPSCDQDGWKVREIRSFKLPIGDGAYVRKLEMRSKSYDLRERSFNAALREAQGYGFIADANKYYDEYVLEFDFKYMTSAGWSEQYTDSYHLHVFFPEGTGSAFEKAINGYLQSSAIQIDPAVA
jgi:hypothetical protein